MPWLPACLETPTIPLSHGKSLRSLTIGSGMTKATVEARAGAVAEMARSARFRVMAPACLSSFASVVLSLWPVVGAACPFCGFLCR